MLRRVLPLLVVLSLGAIPMGAGGCNRGGGPGPAVPQPIRDEKEPGESIDTVSAVPDSGSSSVEDMSSTTTEVEIDEGSSAGDDDGEDDKDAEKSADTDKSGDGGGDSGEDETGDGGEIEIEVEP